MKIKPHYLILWACMGSVVFSFNACKDDDTCKAGTGGNLSIVAKLAHHGMVIPNDSLQPDTVWVKFNASEWANAPTGYDMRVIGEFPEDHVHIDGLQCGKYYLYGSGFDTSINMVVKGGKPIDTDQKDGELVTTIAVTE
jgi:hypothetical protein